MTRFSNTHRGKPARSMALRRNMLALAVAACFAHPVSIMAAGIDPVVVHGSATITTVGNTMTVANSPNAIINWHDLSIASNEALIFQQINASSNVFNRITGGSVSEILGTLQSNGRVFLINPAGIIFGADAVIDVAGLVATSLNMSDADLLSGSLKFAADTLNPGAVINHGQITTPQGGYVYLIAPKVENTGIITTPGGEAILAAGHTVEIVDSANPSQRVKVSATVADVSLSKLMSESGGNIFSVLNRGKVSANSVSTDAAGRIFFKSAGSIETTSTSLAEAKGNTLADGGNIISFADTTGLYAGDFNASGKNGGLVETSANSLGFGAISVRANALEASGKAGTWLIDPSDITVTAFEAGLFSDGLSLGSNVTIATDGAASGTGSITFESGAFIEHSGTANVSLDISAHGSVGMSGVSIVTSSTGRLNVTITSDSDTTSSDGGISLDGSRIDTNGGVSITAHSGDMVMSQISKIKAAFVGITLDSGQLRVQESEVSSSGNIAINVGDGLTLSDGNSSIDKTSSIIATGNLVINTGGNVDISGASAGSASAVEDAILSAGDILQIIFNSPGKRLAVKGGDSGTSSEATIRGVNKVLIGGNTDSDNPLVVAVLGGTGAAASASIESEKEIDIEAMQLDLAAGAGAPSEAMINTELANGIINIALTSDASASAYDGALTMTGESASAIAAIGSDAAGSVTINIRAGSMELNDFSIIGHVGATGGADINLRADSGGFKAAGAGTAIGSLLADATIQITGKGNSEDVTPDGVNISGGAKIKHATGNGDITITGEADDGGGRGITLSGSTIDAHAGKIKLEGTGMGSSGNEDGILLSGNNTLTTTTGSIDLIGNSESTGSNAAGLSFADTFNITSTNGHITLKGSAVGTGNSNGLLVFGSGTATISTTGNIDITANSNVSKDVAVGHSDFTLQSLLGNISINAENNSIDLGNAKITAQVLEILAANGAISQGTTGDGITVLSSLETSSESGVTLMNTNNILKNIYAINSGTGNIDLASKNNLVATIANQSGNINLVLTAGSQFGDLGINGSFYTLEGGIDVVADGNIEGNAIANVEAQAGETGTGVVSLYSLNGGIEFIADTARIKADNSISLRDQSGTLARVHTPSISATSDAGSIDIRNQASSNAATFNTTNSATYYAQGGLEGGVNFNSSEASLIGSTLSLNEESISAEGSLTIKADTLSLQGGSNVSAQSVSLVLSRLDVDNSEIETNSLNIAATSISLSDNSRLLSGSDINIFTKSLSMSDSVIGTSSRSAASTSTSTVSDGNSININSLPLVFSLGKDDATNAQIRSFFNSLTKDAVIDLNNSRISADGDVNIAGSEIHLTGTRITATNLVSLFSRGDITLTGTQVDEDGLVDKPSIVSAGSEVLVVAGGKLILDSGSSSASIRADSAETIFLNFPLLAASGFSVDGVEGAITGSSSETGFFVLGKPAVLDENMFVTYGGIDNTVLSLLFHSFTESSRQTSDPTSVTPGSDKNPLDSKNRQNKRNECS